MKHICDEGICVFVFVFVVFSLVKPGRQSPCHLSQLPRAQGFVLTVPSISMYQSCVESENQAVRPAQLKCHLASFPWCGGFKPRFYCIPIEQQNSAKRKSSCFPPLFFFLFPFFVFLGPHLQHMEVPRLGVELELQLLAYTTATAKPDPSHICNIHHGSGQCWIL